LPGDDDHRNAQGKSAHDRAGNVLRHSASSALHTMNSTPAISTMPAETASACVLGTPDTECRAAASTAADDEVAATIA
jgi:hypothetical protein